MEDTESNIDAATDAAATGSVVVGIASGKLVLSDDFKAAVTRAISEQNLDAVPVAGSFSNYFTEAEFSFTPQYMMPEMLGSSDGGARRIDQHPAGVPRAGVQPPTYSTTERQVATAEVVRQALADIVYKPGWEFRLSSYAYGNDPYYWRYGPSDLLVYIGFTAPDTYHPERLFPVAVQEVLPATLRVDWDEERFLKWVQGRIHFLECHEADEAFLYKGVRVFDPHRPSYNPRPFSVSGF